MVDVDFSERFVKKVTRNIGKHIPSPKGPGLFGVYKTIFLGHQKSERPSPQKLPFLGPQKSMISEGIHALKDVASSLFSVKRIKEKDLKKRVTKLILKISNAPTLGKPMRYERKGTREAYLGPFRIAYFFENHKNSPKVSYPILKEEV